jgi:hypothetical protein
MNKNEYFKNESELQNLIDRYPYLLANALLEMSPKLHGNLTTKLFSLGREISLNSGYLDNLFIDAQGVLTVVECKLYHNSEIKREVYSQVLNYTADIQTYLRNYSNDSNQAKFHEAFTDLLLRNSNYEDFKTMVEDIKKDSFLQRYKLAEWEEQFNIRLEQNIKSGIFRVMIACGPHQSQDFHLSNMQNLMKIMQFSENKSNLYDLSLIDLRREEVKNDSKIIKYNSKIIWRRYCELPQVPLISQSSRNTTAKVDEIQALVQNWSSDKQDLYEDFLSLLKKEGIDTTYTTHGLALYHQNKSLYTEGLIKSTGLEIRRVQIGDSEDLWDLIETGNIQSAFPTFNVETRQVKSTNSSTGFKYHIRLTFKEDTTANQALTAISRLKSRL